MGLGLDASARNFVLASERATAFQQSPGDQLFLSLRRWHSLNK
jgi:hypothetical protein